MRSLSHLGQAKLRSSRRSREGGAVMFIVAMTISVLASVGIYALAAASNEIATSGNERQNTQTHFIAGGSIVATLRAIGNQGGSVYGKMLNDKPTPPSGAASACTSLAGVPLTETSSTVLACYKQIGAGIAKLINATTPPSLTDPYAGLTPYASGVTPGSFGATGISGDFQIELTDPRCAHAPGNDSTHGNMVTVTATTTGITQPLVGSTSQIAYGSEGIEVQQARISMPIDGRCL